MTKGKDIKYQLNISNASSYTNGDTSTHEGAQDIKNLYYIISLPIYNM